MGTGGYKTRQREEILQFLTAHRERHVSADDVANYLREEGSPVGKSTVYRYLDLLVEQGIVRRYRHEDGRGACYQYSDEPDGGPEHFHLKCTCCGKLLHVECDYLSDIAAHVFGHHHFRIDHTKTVLYGLCADCTDGSEGETTCED